MQKECSADLLGFAHVEARGGGGVWDGGKITGGHAPTSNHVSRHRLARLVRVHKGVFFSGVARAERHERDGRRAPCAQW